MIIDGRAIAGEIRREVAEEVSKLKGRKPCLAVVLVGGDPASLLYVSSKTKACEEAGIRSLKKELPASLSENELLREIELLNQNPEVDAILVQCPLPKQIDTARVMRWIDPEKDVDGFHPINVGKMLTGDPEAILPCTPLGIKTLLEKSSIDLEGKHVVILGRSNIVGKPLAAILLQNRPGCNASVTVLHRLSKQTKELTAQADVLISAIGQAHFVGPEMVKEGAVVIDVGQNKLQNGGEKLVGDVSFEEVRKKCSYITPVPGGVGPMTIATLLQNTLEIYKKRSQKLASSASSSS